jgi:hypothetical protein
MDTAGRHRAVIARVDGEEPEKNVNVAPGPTLSWSPDGGSVALVRITDQAHTPAYELYVLRLDGTALRLPSLSLTSGTVAWVTAPER